MTQALQISLGQHSDKGVKDLNQDFNGAMIAQGRDLRHKGIAVALADGISSSSVSQIAAESAVKTFLTDYYCTSDAWTVKTAASRVISATNSWLFAETKRSQHAYDMNKGFVCTFSAIVLKARAAHLFHVGDCRIFRVSGQQLEQLTQDHRVVLSSVESYLGRALGMAQNIEVDYHRLDLTEGDIFILATDGVFEYANANFIAEAAQGNDLDAAARAIVAEALAKGSNDNCTIQIVRIDALPPADAAEVMDDATQLSPAPVLHPPCEFDGYNILRTIHSNSRSHIYLAEDKETGAQVALKVPSVDLRNDPDYLRRFMMEEWIARRLSSPHVLRAGPARARSHLYVVTEFLEGRSLRQWMRDNPRPDLDQVRDIVEQIAKGLRAFHRSEMLHQDLRPENIIIDRNNTVKIIDFGSTRVAGVVETAPVLEEDQILGTVQYTAPEYFAGGVPNTQSDMFSLGIITYEMLTGRLPYGTQVSRATSARAVARLRYMPASSDAREIAPWIDAAIARAVHPQQMARYSALSEFMMDLRRPNPEFDPNSTVPLIQRNPLVFWQSLSALLIVLLIVSLVTR